MEGAHAGGTPAVPVKPLSLQLPNHLRDQLVAEAQATFPRECCGLIEGVHRGETVEALKLHPTRNLAREADRFEIDPMEQFRLLKALRDRERDIVGCYHSHPNGVATPSPRDLASAAEEHFVWLIVGVAADGAATLTAHVYAGGAFCPLTLA
jgi:proteasome lid subunit RPN8/RPN11